jgi:hypothetical protein
MRRREMKSQTIIGLVLVVVSAAALFPTGDKALAETSWPNPFVDQSEKCPETIIVGVVNVPQGWTDYNRRVIPFENLKVTNAPEGSRITCPHVTCRPIPTKK